jgi:flagellin-like hook-associated protein FlgL
MSSIGPLGSLYYQSLNLSRNIDNNQNLLERTLERLSTGLRINRASDDPFGITQVKRIQTQQISNNQATSNTLQAFNLVATAEGGAKDIKNNLDRLRTLILESLNDTSSSSDRAKIQAEVDKLVADTDRVARNEIFNSRQLLDGSLGSFSFSQPASSVLSVNKELTDTQGNTASFLTGNPTLSGQLSNYDVVQFRVFDNGNGGYGLDISTASGGTVLSYNDVLSAPTSIDVPVAGSTVSFDRATYAVPPSAGNGALTNAELSDNIANLVSSGRLDPVTYGNLSLQLGSQNFTDFYNVTGASSISSLLASINGLSTSGTVSATYDTGTGKISIDYTDQASTTTSLITPYISAGTTTGVGGPFSSFGLLPSAPLGPAYRDPTSALPPVNFNLNTPPSGFVGLPGALNTSLSFSGSDSSFVNIFGLSDSSNNGKVTAYTTDFYGQAIATGNPGEYVNRTVASIRDITAVSDPLIGSNTLTGIDPDTTFRVLNTAIVSSSAFAAGDFTIDFGSNGIFSYNAATGSDFDPNSNTIQDILTAINDFKPGLVSASFDVSAGNPLDGGVLTLTNTPDPVYDAKVTAPTVTAGTFTINFGDNGNTFSYNFDPATDTIQSVVSAINGVSGVTADYNAGSDRLTIDNTVAVSTAINGTKVTNPPLANGTFSIDFGSNNTFSTLFDPTSTSINSLVAQINSYSTTSAGGRILATYNDVTDQLEITNTGAPGYDSKITDPGLTVGGTLTANYGSNGTRSITLTNSTTIQDVVNGLSASGVTVTYDEANDTLGFSNVANGPTSTSDTKVNPPLNAGIFSIDFGNGRVFDYAFNPGITIQQFENDLNAYGAGKGITAGYDSNSDQFSINNFAPDVVTSTSKVSDSQGLRLQITGQLDGKTTFPGYSIDLGLIKGKSLDQIISEINAQTSNLTFNNSSGNFSAQIIYSLQGDRLDINSAIFNPYGITSVTLELVDYGTVGTSFASLVNLNSTIDLDPINYSALSSADIGVVGQSNLALGDVFVNSTTTTGSNQISITDNGTGLQAFFQLSSQGDTGSGTVQSAVSAGDIDKSTSTGYSVLDIDGNDFTSTPLSTLISQQFTTSSTAAGNNQITFSDTSGLFSLFQLSNVGSNVGGASGSYTQNTGSSTNIDKGVQGALLDVDGTDFSSTALVNLVQANVQTSTGSNTITFTDGGTGLTTFFKLANGSGSVTSSADIDNGTTSGLLNIDNAGADAGKTLSDLATTQILIGGTPAGDNQITFGGTSNLQDFFKLSNVASNGVGGANIAASSAEIDNGLTGSPFDIIPADVTPGTELTFQQLLTPFPDITPINTISFGGAIGANIASFFKLSPSNPDTGSGTQNIFSTPGIDNRAVDSSLQIQPTDLTRSLASLYTPKLGLVSGDLVLDGNTFTIDPDVDTINSLVLAVDGYLDSASNKTYSASFSGGALIFGVSDTENLSAPGSAAALDPNGATPQVNGNQLTLDTATYLVGGPPPNSYPVFSTTQPPAPYLFTNPSAPSSISDIIFSGSSNLFSVLALTDVSGGTATDVGSPEYRGTYTQSDAVTYALNGEKRQTYSLTNKSDSDKRLGNDTNVYPLIGVPLDGIVAEVAFSPTIASRTGQGLTFQVGPNEGNSLNLNINGLTAEILNLEGLSLYRAGDSNTLSRLRATNALNIVDQALNTTSNTLSQIGVGLNILAGNVNRNEEQSLILSQTLSDLQDANIEEEVSQYTKAQINTQVGAALLADNAANTRSLYNILFDLRRPEQSTFSRYLDS